MILNRVSSSLTTHNDINICVNIINGLFGGNLVKRNNVLFDILEWGLAIIR